MKKMMKLKELLLISCLLFGYQSFAQDDRVLMTVEDEDITVQEFLNIYNKNNTNNVVDQKSMEEYVDLFVNFKLKVKEAESLGMDTIQKFVSELGGYRNQLAQPYLIDKSVNDQLIKEAYDRLTEDVAAYHVLVMVDPNASPKDTLSALNKLKSMTRSIKNEDDMRTLMAQVKAQKNEKVIAEDLGYFTAFSMVYPFESAAYKTPVGELSKPVRTRFGYHVIYVRDRRPARGEISVSHIFIRSNQSDPEDKRSTAKSRIDEISKRLGSGESFDELVKEYSEDKSTVSKGGKLPWFGTGGSSSTFEDAAFALKNNGDISAPIQSNYGWHIIRREDLRGVPEFKDIESVLKKKIEKDSRSLKGRASLLKKLKEEYTISYLHQNRVSADKYVTSDLMRGKWKLDYSMREKLNKPVMTVKDNVYSKQSKTYTQLDYLVYVQKKQKPAKEGEMVSSNLSVLWDQFKEDMLIDFENGILEYKHPDFKALMQEYHDGILLFDLMDQRVWSKAVKDTVGMEAFYQEHKNEYMWSERLDATVYVCKDAAIAKTTTKYAKKRIKKGYTDTEIMTQVNENNPLDLSIKSGVYAQGDDKIVDMAPRTPGIHQFESDGRVYIVQVFKVLDPTPKALSECRGLITSAYQSYLEEAWISELKEKYSVKINQEVFDSINK